MSGLVRELGAVGLSARKRFYISHESYRRLRGFCGRLILRFQMYAAYPVYLAAHCWIDRDTRCRVVCTNTFYAPSVASLVSHPSAKLVHLVYDLFPDVLECAGILRKRGLLVRCLDQLVRATFKRSDANVFLGERLLAYARSRFGDIPRAHVIPVGADGTPFICAEPQHRGDKEPLTILYCGNVGHMHDTQTLKSFLCSEVQPAGRGIKFRFHGHGAGFHDLVAAVGNREIPAMSVNFGGFLSSTVWVEAMKAAEVGLVTMRYGAEDLVMPSKFYSALTAGQAVLAICPRESDLADAIFRYDCGWVVEPGNLRELRDVIHTIRSDSELLLKKRKNAFRAGHEVFDTKHIAARWLDLFAAIGC